MRGGADLTGGQLQESCLLGWGWHGSAILGRSSSHRSSVTATAGATLALGSTATLTTAGEETGNAFAEAGLAGIAGLFALVAATMVMAAAAIVSVSLAGVNTSRLADGNAASHLAADIFAHRHRNALADLGWHTFSHAVRNLHGVCAAHLLGHAHSNSLGHSHRNRLAHRVRNAGDDFFRNHAADSARNLTGDSFHAAGLNRNPFNHRLGDHAGHVESFSLVDPGTFLPGRVANRFTARSATGNNIAIGIARLAGSVVIISTALAVNPGAKRVAGDVHVFNHSRRNHLGHGIGNLAGFRDRNVLDHLGGNLLGHVLADHAGDLDLFLNRSALVDRTGFHVIRFFANLKLQGAALLASSTGAGIGIAGWIFVNQLEGALAGHADLFANRFAHLLADRLGFADRLADLFANRLHDALFHLLAGSDSAVLVAGFANGLADRLGAFLHFADRAADLELAVAGLRLADRLADHSTAFLVRRLADRLAFSDRFHHCFVNRLADGLLAILVTGLVNDLVAGLFNLAVLNLVHRTGGGALFVTVCSPFDFAHLHFFHRLIGGVLAFFNDGVIDRLISGAVSEAETRQAAEEA